MMFQDPYASLDPRMRVHASLREPLVVQRLGSAREQEQRIRTMLDEVGLPHSALERYPHEFSGGQRQRIALARALMLEPKVVVADEPVSALDVSIRSQVLNLMKRLQAEHNMASIVISHDMAVVKYLSDRIGVMYLGKIVEIGTGADIYHRAAHPYTEALIKAIPVPDPAAARRRGRRDPWRAAQPDQPSVRVQVPHPLPAGAGEVRGGRAGAAQLRSRAPGGLPLPAAARGGRERRTRCARLTRIVSSNQLRARLGCVSCWASGWSALAGGLLGLAWLVERARGGRDGMGR